MLYTKEEVMKAYNVLKDNCKTRVTCDGCPLKDINYGCVPSNAEPAFWWFSDEVENED